MPPSQKYHINLLENRVESCRIDASSCPIGTLEQHWYDEEKAQGKLRLWRELNGAWLAKSAEPQQRGWVTEHIFDPERPESFENYHVLFGYDIPYRTRLVIENGWIFTKESFDDFWLMESGYERVGGNKNGQVLKYYNFLKELEEFGGRLEYSEGIEPIRRLPWKKIQGSPAAPLLTPVQQALAALDLPAEKPRGFFARLKSGRRS